MSCSFSTSMKSNCSFSSVLKTNSSFSTVLKTHTYFIPLTPPFGSIFGGGGRNVHYRFYRKRGFLVPPAPPYRIDFTKNRKKIRIDSEWPETARNRKKNFCPLVTPPRKKLRKIFKNFFENFLKVVQNHLKREKNSKFFFSFFFSYTEKKLRKIFKFFF